MEFLHHFRLVAELNEWSEREKGMYLGVLETVAASAQDGYERLLEALGHWYQPPDQVSLYQTQLWAKHQGTKSHWGSSETWWNAQCG